MRVMVTGGTGFVGGHLIARLRQDGHEITALLRSPHKAQRLEPYGVQFVRGHLHDREALEQACTDQQVIFHVAGMVAAHDEDEFLCANRDGTDNVVQAAAVAGNPRFILVSSMAAGGPSTVGTPRRGDEPPRPVTAYGRSKLAGEVVVRESALPWTIIRPPTVYGPGDRELLKLFKLARLGVTPLFTRTQELSAVFAPDLADALVTAAGTEGTVHGTYYPCHAERFTSEQFARAIGKSIGKEVRVVGLPRTVALLLLTLTGMSARLRGRRTILNRDKAHEFFQAAWTGDPTPLETDADWLADHDLESGLAATEAWYRDQAWL